MWQRKSQRVLYDTAGPVNSKTPPHPLKKTKRINHKNVQGDNSIKLKKVSFDKKVYIYMNIKIITGIENGGVSICLKKGTVRPLYQLNAQNNGYIKAN